MVEESKEKRAFPRVLVIGLDGGTFKVIKPALAHSCMPTLQRMIEQGVCGELESVIPPLSTYSWPVFYTGTNAGKLGLFALSKVDKQRNLRTVEQTLANFSYVGSKSLWRILSEHGRRVGVVNIPVTYPPEPVNGFLISGLLTPSSKSEYTYPRELKSELSQYHYEIDVEFQGRLAEIPDNGINKPKVLEDVCRIVDTRHRVCSKLIEEQSPDFFIVNFKELDVLQHLFWGESEILEEHLQKLDGYIASLCEAMQPDVTIIMSDHGFHARSTHYFHINTWLHQEGFLQPTRSIKGRALSCLYNLGLDISSRFDLIRKMIPNRLKQWGMSEKQTSKQIDCERTRAFGSRWGIYLNTDILSDDEYATVKARILESLRELSEDAQKVFQRVVPKENIPSGPYHEALPDLVLLPSPAYKVNPNLHRDVITRRIDSPDKSGDHSADPVGILIVSGANIARRKRIDNARLIDLAPTILHLMDVPVPEDMDGRVLKEIFAETSKLAIKPIDYQRVGERVRIEQKIRRLKQAGRL